MSLQICFHAFIYIYTHTHLYIHTYYIHIHTHTIYAYPVGSFRIQILLLHSIEKETKASSTIVNKDWSLYLKIISFWFHIWAIPVISMWCSILQFIFRRQGKKGDVNKGSLVEQRKESWGEGKRVETQIDTKEAALYLKTSKLSARLSTVAMIWHAWSHRAKSHGDQ